MKYEKHKYNIFPEMQSDDYNRLRDDIRANGYDEKQPIYLYNGAVLDGWNRYTACTQLGIQPTYKEFEGNYIEAINFVMRTNKRRNLNSTQWACIAVEADDIIEVLKEETEKERRAKQAETQSVTMKQDLSDNKLTHRSEPERVTTKLATTFNTNRTYVSQAQKLKETAPEKYEQAKRGEKTFTEIAKEEKTAKLAEKKAEYIESAKAIIEVKPEIKQMDCVDFLNEFEDNSIDLLFTDPPYATDVDNIAEFTKKWLTAAIEKTKKTGRLLVCSGAYPIEMKAFLDVLLSQTKFIVDNPIVWTYKNTLGVTPKMKYNLNYQLVWHLYSDESKELDTSITNEMFSVMEINAPDGRQGNRLHTWQKPDELALRLIRHTTNENDLVVDPFCCTGTFLLAANRLKRNSKGCDINLENLKIAESRGCTIIGK